MNFCTIFDSNYIDRALVMYDSLVSTCKTMTMYVIAFDQECADALVALCPEKMVVIPFDEFEDETLRNIRSNRTPREFFWTCGSYSIRYIINRFDLDECTYIDADLLFYDSVEPAVNRFLNSKYDVAILSHRYSKHPENEYNTRMFGEYCVEFNTFKNTPNGMRILNWWTEKCIERCPEHAVDGLFGDQKYIEEFSQRFTGVYIYDDFGLGVAPWNVDDYIQKGNVIENKRTREEGRLLFYHFHNLDICMDGSSNIRVFVRPGRHDRALVERLYTSYIKRILQKRKILHDRFGMFNENEQQELVMLHEGELKTFLTCEPSLLFLVRKIWRYLFNKKKDYIRVRV